MKGSEQPFILSSFDGRDMIRRASIISVTEPVCLLKKCCYTLETLSCADFLSQELWFVSFTITRRIFPLSGALESR